MLIISQIKYLHKILEEFPEVVTSSKSCPFSDHLFKIQEDKDRYILCKEMANQFHCTVSQLLFLCKRARPDVEMLVYFLTTRVKEPDTDNWGKLWHDLMYLKVTLYMNRHLNAKYLKDITWWVDRLF